MSFLTVPKISFINIPLWVALLITSVVHIVLILWLDMTFHKNTKQQKAVAITFVNLKLATQPIAKEARKSVAVKKVVETPVAKSVHQPVDSSIKPKLKKRQVFSHPNPKNIATRINPITEQKSVPKTPVIEAHVADNSVEPVLVTPDAPESSPVATMPVTPTVVEPIATPTPQVETPPVVPDIVAPPVSKAAEIEKVAATPELMPPAISDKAVDLPAKPIKKARKKAAKKSSSGTEPIQPVLSMDDLAAQIAQVGEKFGNQAPSASESRIKPLNSVREHKASARQYKQDWRNKIERIANLNFPEVARQKDFSARLVLEVGINADGSIHNVRVKKSSGTPALDEAAKNIVQMGAPFAALPKDLAEELDVLILQQPMQFSDESGVIAQ